VEGLARLAGPVRRRRTALRLPSWLAARPLAWQVPAVLAFWAAVWAFLAVAAERHGFFDLKVYHGAINFWAHGEGELYDYLLRHTEYGFTYPPFAALTMLPMAAVAWPVAIAISLTLTVAASLAVLYWLVDPIARRRGWTRWFTLAIAAGLAAAFEPMRETVNFGQVNMLLVFLVAADLLLFVRPGRRSAGVLIGLATAIKLTPGLFVLYLLITRRFRAAAVAAGTAAAATLFAAAVIPDASREFWTDALWNTGRIGSQSFISNQSLNGFVARLDPLRPSRVLWLALGLAALAVWVWRVRKARAAGDEVGGFALTAVAGCLLSPITWVHHLVWLLPAVVRLFDVGLDRDVPARRRRWTLFWAVAVYALLSSRLVWQFAFHFGGWGLLFANSYVWASVILLVALPLRSAGVAEHGQADQLAGRALDGERPGLAVGDEAAPLVEPPGRAVRVEHP
jgi:alpha-1,2-mannosyltransferase